MIAILAFVAGYCIKGAIEAIRRDTEIRLKDRIYQFYN